MTILEVINIKTIDPVTLTEEELKEKVPFDLSGQEIKAQTGTVVIESSLQQGELSVNDRIVFLFDSMNTGIITSFEKLETGIFLVHLKLETIYLEGLELSLPHFLIRGKMLVSLTDAEKNSLLMYKNQKQFLATLLRYFLPSKQDSILNLAIKSYRCGPIESDDESKSHFLGKPKHNVNSLFHLSTLFSDQIEELKSIQNLSFYLDVNNSESGWPEKEGDFKVIEGIDSSLILNEAYYENANNFKAQIFLDIPNQEHSSMFHLNLSYDEIDLYTEMRSFYFEHIQDKNIKGEEANKIFGYPDSIQNCVSYEAERIKNKREYNDDIYVEAQNWMLLLQVSPYCKMFDFFKKFGDGSIYFMINKNDFQARNFENCQVVVQNT